jgi:Phage tail baseplate hub (GPD)
MSKYQVILDGSAVGSDFYDALSSVEVEENVDLPDALRLKLPVSTKGKDLTWVNDSKLKPFTNVAVVITPEDGANQCIFDGYVLSHKIHLESGVTASTLEVTGQDASVLMGLEERTREFAGMTHGEVANTIFGEHGFGRGPHNTDDDSPAATEDTHTLLQRGTDIDFLRRLARRDGRWCRVVCGEKAGDRTGVFEVPDLKGEPALVLDLNDPDKSQVKALDFVWDVARPTKVATQQASFADTDPVVADTSDGGLPALDARDLRTFAGRDRIVMLTAAADDADLPGRARAVLREAGWFARCEGTTNLALTKIVLRVGNVVAIEGVGTLLSGRHLVKSVRHTITANAHEMAFTLVRNAVGPAA